MIKRFLLWLTEDLFDHSRIDTNPSKSLVVARLNKSQNKALRYLHNTKTGQTHIADAGQHTHSDISIVKGEHEFHRNWEGEPEHYRADHYMAGMIHSDNIHKIKEHPHGLRGFASDLYKKMPNANTWESIDD